MFCSIYSGVFLKIFKNIGELVELAYRAWSAHERETYLRISLGIADVKASFVSRITEAIYVFLKNSFCSSFGSKKVVRRDVE